MKRFFICLLSIFLCFLTSFSFTSCEEKMESKEENTTQVGSTLPSAPNTSNVGTYLSCDNWSMGESWQDVSTDKVVAFKALSTNAGPNFYLQKINGSNGFSISFDVHFEDASVQTTPLIDFRINSSQNTYFRILPTGIGGEAIFQVDFCNNGPWFSVVACKRGISGLVDSTMNVTFYCEKGSSQIHFILSSNGSVIYETQAENSVFNALGFFSRTDLELIVTPLDGYGLFTISNLVVE